jgi:16S rRNA (guanine527-N7)-methyltransferase
MTYEEMRSLLKAGEIDITDKQIEQLHSYAKLLKEWNEKMNLTTISEEPEVVEKHFYDCLLPAKFFSFEGKTIADLGTGAGFPGLVLAIAFPTAHVTLVDATRKKCNFLKEVISATGLTNVDVVNERAEELRQRESFDVVTARALGSLPILLEIALPLLKVGGTFLAMKSAKGKEELASSVSAMKKLQCSLSSAAEDTLPSGDGFRVNYFFRKDAKTPSIYPRSWADIESKPL